jgi:hypothetical protein
MAMTIILVLISIAVGALITLLVARRYYDRASGDLEREAGELKDYTVILLNYLDDAGVIEVERDAQGSPVRVRVIKREETDSIDVSESVGPNSHAEYADHPRNGTAPDS